MASRTQDERQTETDMAVEPGYLEWKRRKIEIGLAQTKDRSVMIPAEKIWGALKLEG